MTQVSFACLQILAQLEGVINKVAQDDFCRPSPTLNGSTIGQHIRHTLEFFVCMESGFKTGVINYDKRAHDKLIETNKSAAIASITRIRNFVNRETENKSLTLEVCYQRHDNDFCTISTNYDRELVYTIEHAIHHMAIMKIAVTEIAPYVELDEHFGVAISTIRYKDAILDSGN